MKSHKPRIIAGAFRNHPLLTPDDGHLRPTRSMVRKAGFSMVSSRMGLEGAHVLDLCCGLGALGLEALSRGAAHVTFVDLDPAWARKNLGALKVAVNRFTLVAGDALAATPTPPADLVLADPPYNTDITEKLLARREPLGAPGALWLLETEAAKELAPEDFGFELLVARRYGISKLWLLRDKRMT